MLLRRICLIWASSNTEQGDLLSSHKRMAITGTCLFFSFGSLYSVRGLERSELGWADLMAAQGAFGTDFYDMRPGQPWNPPSSLRSKPRTEYRIKWWPHMTFSSCILLLNGGLEDLADDDIVHRPVTGFCRKPSHQSQVVTSKWSYRYG